MSVKIYNGLMIPKAMTAFELAEFWKSIKTQIEPKLLEMRKDSLTYDMLFMLDLFIVNGYVSDYWGDRTTCLSDLKKNESIFSRTVDIERRLQSDLARPLREWYPRHDFTFDLRVYPLKDKTLFIPYSDINRIDIKDFTSDMHEYGYFDSVDKPNDISSKEWKQRKCDWNDALDMEMIVFKVEHEALNVVYDVSNNFQYDEDERLKRITNRMLIDGYFDYQKLSRDLSSLNALSYLKKAYNWQDTENGKEAFQIVKNRLKTKLPNVDYDVLVMTLLNINEAFRLDRKEILEGIDFS